jgi:DNA polymerase-3 subunit delta
MTKNPPVVYLLHGEDEFAIAQFVAELKARLGDPALAELNTTRLDGRASSFDELAAAAYAVPFLAPRRLVLFYHPLARFSGEPARQKFQDLLDRIPASTALVLIEHRALTEEAARKRGQLHWLEKWATEAGDRAYLKAFSIPSGAAMADWIRRRARELAGQFTPQAAGLLASLVGDDVRLADQEIQKLLVYVNFSRPVEADDVDLLTAYSGEGDIFALVDALGNRNGQQAMGMLHRLLAEQDVSLIFGMVVRQFRLLLQAREILDAHGNEGDILRLLKVHPYVARKVTDQARRFSLPALETVYRRLLEIDVATKSGEMETDLGMDTLIARLTLQG